MTKSLNTVFFAVVLSVFSGRTTAQNELDVLSDSWVYFNHAPNSLYNHLTGEAFGLLNHRSEAVSRLNSVDDWKQWQLKIRETLQEIVGPFPEKTPLNARITGIIKKEGFRIEHVVFESQPGFYVTSSLFIPGGLKRNEKAPAVIYCSGHSAEGYRSATYMHVILNLVKKGFIVFAFDPVGQGERLEYFDPKSGKSLAGGPTKEHSIPGAQAFISGSSQARYMIWDGIRAVDYLFTRKEVDTSRIGITGRSGGGTQSAYIAALDDRIYAAAPENYLTSFTRLFQTIGPQDAEQNFLHGIKQGLDHADLLLVRAPKPALMITTTRDMFSIQGAMETEKEVSRIYAAYGKPDNFSRAADDAGHESTKKNREAMYAFFQKHLSNPGNPADEEIQPLTREELKVTQTGQISTSLAGETVFSLNRKEAEDRVKELNELRKNAAVFLPGVISNSKQLSGYREPSSIDEPVFTGRIQRGNYAIEKYFIKGEGDYIIPYLLFKPVKPGKNVMIYLHPSGKSAEASPGGEIERFVNQGITVFAPDMIGTGEMGPGALKGDAYFDGASHNLWYASMLIGRSITGTQAGDVLRLVNLIKRDLSGAEITGFARKEMAPVLMHAGVFSNDIRNVILVEPYSSYKSIVMNRFYDPQFILSSVPAALNAYDLPDLAAAFAPRRLFISGTVDGNGDAADNSDDLEIIRSAYKNRNAEDRLKIVTEGSVPEGWLP
jgi:cephalosporin-C deacetylase-like acetyl esterase